MENKDVSKLRVKGKTFNIKDASARDILDSIFRLFGNKFDESLAYKYGDYVLKDNTLYKFLYNKEPGGWNPNFVETSVVLDELGKGTGGAIRADYSKEDEELIFLYIDGNQLIYSGDTEELTFLYRGESEGGGDIITDEGTISEDTLRAIAERVAIIVESNMNEISDEQVSDMFADV